MKEETTDALSVMTDAIEGQGLAHWAEAKSVRRNKNNEVTSFYVRASDAEEPSNGREWHKIDARKVIAAASDMRNGRTDVRRDIAAQFIPPYEYDSEGVSFCIKIAAFGELVFG